MKIDEQKWVMQLRMNRITIWFMIVQIIINALLIIKLSKLEGMI